MRLFLFPLFCQLTPLLGDNDKWPRPPTSVQKLQTPVFGQVTFHIVTQVNDRFVKGVVAVVDVALILVVPAFNHSGESALFLFKLFHIFQW